jgi:predicted O-methyltransferase YrrM
MRTPSDLINHLNMISLNKTPGLNWHEDFIVHLANRLRPKVYVELGLYQCALFNRIVPYAEKLIGVDTVESAGNHMRKSPKTRFFHGTTDALAKELKKNPVKIDLLFIDADHSKESVTKDFTNFFPFISEQGVILLHDGYPENKEQTASGYCGDGYKAIEKLSQETGEYEMMTIPIPPGLTLCRKRQTQVPWQKK